MSSRVKKTKSKSACPHPKTLQRSHLLEAILRSSIEMQAPCSSCKALGLVCRVSPSESSACSECVRRHESFCDAQGVTPQQLQRIAAQHDEVESELERAEELAEAANAKVRRLRKQKKLWFEKMKRAIARGIDTVEELERVEREEAEALAVRESSGCAPSAPATPPLLDADFVPLWDAVYPEVQLEPVLMSHFGLLVGSPSFVEDPLFLAGQGSSGGTPEASRGTGGS